MECGVVSKGSLLYSSPPRRLMSGMTSLLARVISASARLTVGVGDARGGTLLGDGVEDLLFVDFGPAVFEIASDDGLRKIGLADECGQFAPLLAQDIFLF